jgi:uncharacterized protein (TIGR02996 family)
MPPKPAFPQPAATLPGEADILANVVADLSDDSAKLVYADWLEERDDPRGAFLRETLAAVRAGGKLPTPKFAPQPWLELTGLTLIRNIHGAELASHMDRILRLARPAIAYKPVRASEKSLPLGASRLGGGPDLPPGEKWPTLRGEPLAFIGQFNLAELHASVAGRELPSSGLLSVFCAYDPDEANSDFPKGSWRLLYFPNASKLVRCLPPEVSFHSCRLEFRETVTFPDPDSPWKRELGLRGDFDREVAYRESVSRYGWGHRLLGHPSAGQTPPKSKTAPRPLLAIQSDDTVGWTWGDRCTLYFTIPDADLKAAKFDRVRFEIQCG